MTRTEYETNLNAAARELDKVIVDVFKRYSLTPGAASYLIAEIMVKITKYPVDREAQWLAAAENN